MAYEKQNFSDGQVLTADHLNHMEQGIAGAVQTVNGMAADASGNVQVSAEGTGLNDTAKTLLITILRNGVYTTDQSLTIDALEQVLNGDEGGEGDETPEVVYYTISNNLSNVTTSNTAGAVEANTAYGATLTAAKDHSLGRVTVTMGGEDITDTVYANGVISIPAVTGDIIITAEGSPNIQVTWYLGKYLQGTGANIVEMEQATSMYSSKIDVSGLSSLRLHVNKGVAMQWSEWRIKGYENGNEDELVSTSTLDRLFTPKYLSNAEGTNYGNPIEVDVTDCSFVRLSGMYGQKAKENGLFIEGVV